MANLVQQVANSQAAVPNSGTLNLTFPVAPSAGDVLVMFYAGGLNGTLTIGGGGVSQWHFLESAVHEDVLIAYGKVISALNTLFIENLGGTADICVICTDWAGITTDQSAFSAATGTASPTTTATVATSGQENVLFSVGGDTGSMTVGSPGAGWTALTPPTQQPGAKIEAAYRIGRGS